MQLPRPLDHRYRRGAPPKVREVAADGNCHGLLCQGQQQAPSKTKTNALLICVLLQGW